MPLKTAREVAAEHRPQDGAGPVCPACTRLGVGNSRGPVWWPCDPYWSARAALHAAGEARPVPDDTEVRPGQP